MKKNRRIRLLSLLLAMLCLVTLLPGCGVYDLDLPIAQKQHVQNVEDGWISGVRTGILRQGISGQFKSYECTDERVYFMVNVDGKNMLYSMKHDEDVLTPLCPIGGCSHTDPSCSAWFGANGNVCYYDEALFVNSGPVLYRMNPDGTDRMVLYDVKMDEELGGYTAIANPKLWNGMFTFDLIETTWDDGARMLLFADLRIQVGSPVPCYYKLDGSMGRAQVMGMIPGETSGMPIAMYNDGYEFIMSSRSQGEAYNGYYLAAWNPEANSFRRFADVTAIWGEEYMPAIPDTSVEGEVGRYWGKYAEAYGEGYWGKDYAIFLQTQEDKSRVKNNRICRLDYAAGKPQVLMDTGLEGSWRLCCFPDCFVLIETMNNNGHLPDPPRMLIYSWEMELLGDDLMELDLNILPQDLICGETADRIYLAAGFNGVPEYYIEKKELQGGDITLHALTYENLDLTAFHDHWTQIIDDRVAAILEQEQKLYEEYFDED